MHFQSEDEDVLQFQFQGRHSTSSVGIGTTSNETSIARKKRYAAPTESSQAKRKSWRPDIGEGHGLLVKDNGMMVENVSTMDKCYINLYKV